MALTNSLVVIFIAVLLQIFGRNFYSNASCFPLLWLYLGNIQVSVYRTIGPTLVWYFPFRDYRFAVQTIRTITIFTVNIVRFCDGSVLTKIRQPYKPTFIDILSTLFEHFFFCMGNPNLRIQNRFVGRILRHFNVLILFC